MTHLLRRLEEIADAAKVPHATLHKFRHTYATRLLETGCNIVTVQPLMGHSDLDTTRQYLDPDEAFISPLSKAPTCRFEREAKAIAALNHLNICTLYDIGPNYLVMGFIEGTPLHGPLP